MSQSELDDDESKVRKMSQKIRGISFQRLWHFVKRSAGLPRSLFIEMQYGLVFIEPCYYIRPILNQHSTILDCGTGHDANFSQALIARFGVKSIGIDPTLKHKDALKRLEQRMAGRFEFLPYAMGAASGKATFFQSQSNESGSFYSDHENVKRDQVISYKVDVLTLEQLFDRIHEHRVDLLKLDIEGAEFAVFEVTADESVRTIPQIVIELHHGKVDRWQRSDSGRLIRRLLSLGYQWHTRDSINYLFFRTDTAENM
jgi:FkbM family methyltransferase